MCLTPTRAREVLARASHDANANTAHRYLTMEEFRCVFSWCVNNRTTFKLHDANKRVMQQAIERAAGISEQRKPSK